MKKITTLFSALVLTAFGWQAQAQFCAAGPSSTSDSNFESIALTGDGGTALGFTACPGVAGVQNLTATQTVDVTAGSAYTADIQFGTCGGNYGGVGEAWIDWNQDFTFDPSESIGTWSGTPPTTLSSMAFTVPALAVNGNTVLRVMQRESGSLPLDPCGTFTWGSAADFTIVVSGGVTICNTPSNLTVTSITTVSADLGWTENGAATVWDIEMDTAGFTATGTPTTVGTTTNPTNATGLTANTSYEFYVRASCGGPDSSAWAGPFSFTTPCNALAVPFAEDFSSTSATQNCWTVLNDNADADMWDMNYTTNPLVGDEVAMMYTDGNGGANDDYLISPTLTLTGAEELRYSYRSQSSFEATDYQILVSTTGIGAANFTDTLLVDTVDNTVYEERTIDLTAYTGDVNIAFHVPIGGLDGWRLYIDDVRVSEACLMPTAGVVSNITSSSASLGWATTGTAAATWSIEYGPTGFVQGTGSVINGTTFNPHPLAGLTGGTTYDYYIISNCALGDRSPWAGPFNFTTFITGVDENSANNSVSIYPNPNNGIFTLNVNATDATVKVMNTQGQIILNKNILKNVTKIDLSNNAKGIYFVTVTSNEGVTTQKVIVQ